MKLKLCLPSMSEQQVLFVLCCTVTGLIFESLFPSQGNYCTAALLGVLGGGAGITTPFAGQSQLEEFIVIGDCDTANPLQGLYISNNSDTKIDIQSAVLITAFLKLYNQFVGTVVGCQFRVATGRIPGNTTYRFTNAGATTPNIYVSSSQESVRLPNGKTLPTAPVLVTTDNINANSNQTFKDFTALLIVATNVSSIDVTMWDGSVQNMQPLELDAWFSEENQAEANGRLESTVTTIDNRNGKYRSVKINTSSGGAVTLAVVRLPDGYFKAIQENLN